MGCVAMSSILSNSDQSSVHESFPSGIEVLVNRARLVRGKSSIYCTISSDLRNRISRARGSVLSPKQATAG
jgi:hypothetical protein